MSEVATIEAGAVPVARRRARGYWGNVWQRLRYDYVSLTASRLPSRKGSRCASCAAICRWFFRTVIRP